jgi:hypothetical protein
MRSRDIQKIPRLGTTAIGNVTMRRKMVGRFIVASDGTRRVWYVNYRNKRRIAIDRQIALPVQLASQLSTISPDDFASIPLPANIDYHRQSVTSSRGTYTVDMLTFSWADSSLAIKTDTASNQDCGQNCPVKSLGSFVSRRNAVAGIHGTYFCPQDYSWCAGKRNAYNAPVLNSFSHVTINGKKIKYTSEPIVVIASDNQPYYYPAGIDLYSLARFTATTGKNVQAMFSNGPGLIAGGKLILKSSQMDTKQATVKAARGVFGWQGETMYLFVVQRATVTDAAAVADALDLDYAVNLDGGGSTALFNDGRYILGPGRSLPNAILVTRK